MQIVKVESAFKLVAIKMPFTSLLTKPLNYHYTNIDKACSMVTITVSV